MNPAGPTTFEQQIAAALDNTARATFGELAMPQQLLDPALRVDRAGPGRRYLPLVAAVVVVGAVVPIALLVGGASGSHNYATTHVPAAAVAASLTPSATTLLPSGTAGDSITPQAAAQILITLLPRAGKITDLSGQFTTNFATSQLVYDDDRGAAQLSIAVGEGQGFVCVTQPGTPGCQTLPNGDQIFVSQGLEYPPGKPRSSSEAGVVSWDVQLQRPDGVLVDVTEWNAPTEKDSSPSRPEPPFTLSELTVIASSDRWQMTIPPQVAKQAQPLFTPSEVPTR
jgi:hypothetical protein